MRPLRLALALLLLLPLSGSAQVRSGPGTTLITPSGTSVMDEANTAVRINCVLGCGAGGGSGTKIVDGTAAGEADVLGSAPTGTEQGLVVRPIPSGTQPVSGTVSANLNAGSNLVGKVQLRNPGNTADLGDATNPVRIDPTGTTTQPVSGTVTANAGTGNFNNASVGTVGSSPPSSATYLGVRSAGILQPIIACDSSVAINVAASGTTELVALTAGQTIYVCGWDVIANGTVNVKFLYGTGTACATGPVDLTGPYALTAQAGLARGGGLGTIARTAASNALCINLSAAVQVSGMVSYTKMP